MPHLHMIQWPDSGFGIRIPKELLEQIGVRENDELEIFCQKDTITIRKAPFHHRTLEERLTSFYGKPLEEISPINQEKLDWGEARGDEV